jgi:hypothetical protein
MKTHKLLTIALLTWDRRKDMMYLSVTFHLTLISNSRLSDNVMFLGLAQFLSPYVYMVLRQ